MKRLAIILVFCSSVVHGQINDFCTTNFHQADSIAEHFMSYSLRDLKTLSDNLTCNLVTDQEKFRAIYTWVCTNIEADYDLVLLNKENRTKLSGDQLAQWNRKFNKLVFEKLQERKTVCTGYAYLVRELAFHAGLTCKIVNGYANHAGVSVNQTAVVNHSWNEILLNTKWYACDATWSSGIYNRSTRKFIKKYDDRFFLMEPTEFLKTHCREVDLR